MEANALESIIPRFNSQLSMKNASSSANDPTESPHDFMSIPREIRDQIYSDILVSTYRVDKSPTGRRSLQLEPDDAYEKPSEATAEPLLTFEEPSSNLSILRVNSTIGNEAKEVLYNSSTFIIAIGSTVRHSSVYFTDLDALPLMKNIEIYVSMPAEIHYKSQGEEHRIQSVKNLLDQLTTDGTHRNSCILGILNVPLSDSLAKSMKNPLKSLTQFKEVELRIVHPNTSPRDSHLGPLVIELNTFKTLMHASCLHQQICNELGAADYGYDSKRMFRINWHPRGFSEKSDQEKTAMIGPSSHLNVGQQVVCKK